MTTKSKNGSLFFLPAFLFSLMMSCSNPGDSPSSIYGKYKAFSNNPSINQFIINEDNYIMLNDDKAIIYHTTINGKPKFNFKGRYDYMKESGTLNIKWEEGKLPDQLRIEKSGEDYLITIGETLYKKEKNN